MACLSPSRRLAIASGAVLAAAFSAACELEPPLDDAWDIPFSPVSTPLSLVWADNTNHRALFYLPELERDRLRSVALGDSLRRPLWMRTGVGGHEVFALLYNDDPKREDIEPELVRMAADGSGEPEIIPMKAAFTAIEFTPDGRRAILFFGAGASGEVISNVNQVAIVDLETSAVRDLTLDGFGGAVERVVFPARSEGGTPEPIAVGGTLRELAVFFADSECVLVDMANEDANQVAIGLDTNLGFSAVSAIIRPGDAIVADPVLVLRGQSWTGNDLIALHLVPKPGEPASFTVQISLLALKGTPGEVAFFDQGDIPWIVATQVNRSAIEFVDLRTAASFEVDEFGATAHLFIRETLDDGGNAVPQLVAWREGGGQITTLELDELGSSIGKKPVRLKIDSGIDHVRRISDNRLLVGSGYAVMYAVDLDTDSVSPLGTTASFDVGGAETYDGTLLLAAPGTPWVGTLELSTLDPKGILLDDDIRSFHVLEDAEMIVTVHDDPTGRVTVLDAADPSRASARVRWGMLLEGALD